MDAHDGQGGGKNIETIFKSLSTQLEREASLKQQISQLVKEIELISRCALSTLQQTHSNVSEAPEYCKKARKQMEDVRPLYQKIKDLIPNELSKYHDHWKYSISQLVFASAIITWIETGKLVNLQEASEMILGHSNELMQYIELEDFLTGLSFLPNELARFSVNFAVSKDYERPKQIAVFVAELFAGFRLLNLKNDGLRKRFDSIKYDLKKCEEIVYDISIRGLSSTPASS
eukprot:TRINITY_DN13796_c0_g1_i1.p1 TRINITY_DN13796_c0_g1~~TRINITY_DN13796_c0_g1_i1.p1  ORF type:complete len:250 (+),score=60.59 TRINITY_DN13796_c0_g1_i1:58-750(+)